MKLLVTISYKGEFQLVYKTLMEKNPVSKDLIIKSLKSELEQRAGLQPYLDGVVKEIISKLHIVYKEK